MMVNSVIINQIIAVIIYLFKCVYSSNINIILANGAVRDSNNCPAAFKSSDLFTKEIATCLYDNTIISNLSSHLIVVELHRSKLDANREINQAAQGNNISQQAWNEVHSNSGFIQKAKDYAMKK